MTGAQDPAPVREPPVVRIDPGPESWRGLLARHRSDRLPPEFASAASVFRAEVDLPVSGPLLMTGHQAMLWHPGILAKYLALDAASAHFQAQGAWLVVDQDEAEFHELRLPVRTTGGDLAAMTWRVCDPPAPGASAASCPSFVPRRPDLADARPALDSVARGIERIMAALARASGEASAAAQIAGALADLLEPLVVRRPVVFASGLGRTSLFGTVLRRLCADPRAAAEQYNHAARSHPEARLAALQIGDERVELPLWWLQPGVARRRVMSDDPALAQHLRDGATASGGPALAPRALLATALMRMGACDLFIHGTGGGVYDRATEQWASAWLGATLAPTVVVTADLLLPLPEGRVDARAAARAVARAHRARHSPRELGRPTEQAQKDALVAQIADARRRGEDPLPAYLTMHALLERVRTQSAPVLAALVTQARELSRAAAAGRLARDRTWAFAFYDPGSLAELKASIARLVMAG